MGNIETKVAAHLLPQMRDLAKTIEHFSFANRVREIALDFLDPEQLLKLEMIVAILDDRIYLPPTLESLRYAWKSLLRYPFRTKEQLQEGELVLTRTLSEAKEYLLSTGQREPYSELCTATINLFAYERKTVDKRQECIDSLEHCRTDFFDDVILYMPEQPLRLLIALQSFTNLYESSLDQQNMPELIINIQETELWRLQQVRNNALELARNRAYHRICCDSNELFNTLNETILLINKYQTAQHRSLQLNLF